MEMEYDVSAISALRARIAKHAIRHQVQHTCEALQRSINAGPSFHRGIDIGTLDPQLPPPILKDIDFEEISRRNQEAEAVDFNIGIVGGGMAGLYASLILDDLGLKHEVIEASNRPGGRVQTHRFSPKNGDYYEVGAMLFGDAPIMARTFGLLKLLGIERDTSEHPKQGSLIPMHFQGPNNPFLFNNILRTDKLGTTEVDPFEVPGMGYPKILTQVAEKWRRYLIDDFDSAWKELMHMDMKSISLRQYLIENYPAQADEDPRGPMYMTNWCETMTMGTGFADVGFLTWLLHAIEFRLPTGLPITHDAQPITDKKEPLWWILNGGSDILASKLAEKLKKKPLYNHKVTKIARRKEHVQVPGERRCGRAIVERMVVTMQRAFVEEPIERVYSHIITTATTPCLRRIDLRDAGLRYAQREAIRVLRYDRGLRVGIKFERRWWAEDRGIKSGGIGKTDRLTRIVVYPSYALDTPSGEPGVLMACYNWAEDAFRLAALAPGADQTPIFDAVMADLAAMHDYPEKDLRRMVLEYHVHDWGRDPLALGHITSLAPGQFSTFFGEMHKPAAAGRLVFAGEFVSIYHGWIVAALNSAYLAVFKLLLAELFCELFHNIRTWQTYARVWFLRRKLDDLKHKWSYEQDVETEFDMDLRKISGWQAFLALIDEGDEVWGGCSCPSKDCQCGDGLPQDRCQFKNNLPPHECQCGDALPSHERRC